MKRFIITDKPACFSDEFGAVMLIDITSFNQSVPDEWSMYASEYLPFTIANAISNTEKVVIGIDFSIEPAVCNNYLIAYHILSSLDAAIFFFSDSIDISLNLELDFGLFRNKAVRLLKVEKMREVLANDAESTRYKMVFDENFDKVSYRALYSRFVSMDRHQATNEWAATKLLINYGMTLADIESRLPLSKTIYFKNKLSDISSDLSNLYNPSPWFQRMAELRSAKSKFALNLRRITKIILIDDNADRGWHRALQIIFGNVIVHSKTTFRDATTVNFSDYDLILLDLRLPTDITALSPLIANGYELIKQIKSNQASLSVPLIVFTASQKAKTLDTILQLGADAMYTKEYIDYAKEESLENYLELLSTINFQLEKAETLRKYWSAIQTMQTSFLPEIVDRGSIILKKRIIERLEMFYGLLKKNFEQSRFNHDKFHFSSDVLSYITLWSILNEIQECYFEKGVGRSNIILWDRTQRAQQGIALDDWKIRGQMPECFFLKESLVYEEIVDPTGRRALSTSSFPRKDTYTEFRTKKTAPYYEVINGAFAYQRNLKERISWQIAFLILRKNALKTSPNVTTYLGYLNSANKQRNKLYITHGEDVDTAFHTQLESAKLLSGTAILNLFKLITFLLTGRDNII